MTEDTGSKRFCCFV